MVQRSVRLQSMRSCIVEAPHRAVAPPRQGSPLRRVQAGFDDPEGDPFAEVDRDHSDQEEGHGGQGYSGPPEPHEGCGEPLPSADDPADVGTGGQMLSRAPVCNRGSAVHDDAAEDTGVNPPLLRSCSCQGDLEYERYFAHRYRADWVIGVGSGFGIFLFSEGC